MGVFLRTSKFFIRKFELELEIFIYTFHFLVSGFMDVYTRNTIFKVIYKFVSCENLK